MKHKILISVVGGCFLLLCLAVWLKPDTEYSVAERRKLKQAPELTVDTIVNGQFMSNFESYRLDQFPLRDTFRSFKAITSLKADNNDLYVVDGRINSMEYPLDEMSLKNATEKFQNIYDKYLQDKGCKVYLSIIPDKNYFYGEENGYLEMDYDKLVANMTGGMEYAEYIDIFPLLSGENYYKTDTHWKQESLTEVAVQLVQSMEANSDAEGGMAVNMSGEKSSIQIQQSSGTKEVIAQNQQEQQTLSENIEYQVTEATEDFYGVYYGQAALPLKPDQLKYVTNEIIEGYKVFDYQNNKEIPVYDESKMQGHDPYELFLSGPLSLVTIENPKGDNGRHLIIFRDSFGSSIAPLLAQNYGKTTLIDIRYLQSAILGNFVDFSDADVLFLYSTLVLNHSETLK